MAITALSLTNGTLTAIFDGSTVFTAREDHPKWPELREAFKSQDEMRLRALLSLKAVVEEYSVGLLSVTAAGVTYRGNLLHTVDSERVMAFLRDGLPYKPIANYIVRKMMNPSSRAIREMYNFLEHRGMPLTPAGTFIAYKGVQPNWYSVHGNKNTVVIRGTVNEEGQIYNAVGETIEVERSSVDDDFRVGCSHGLHAGSLAYARGWAERVILVEIDPADVVSVPGDENCQKLRCCKYTVVGEYNGPLPDTYTPEFSSDQSDDSGNSHDSGTGAGDCCDNCDCSDYDCSDGSCECCDDPNEVSDKCQSCSDCNDSAPDAPISPSVQPDECPICNYDKFACVCSEEKVQSTPQPQVANINNNAHSNLSEIGRRFLEVLAEQLGIEKESISLNQRISDLGVDSLDIIEIAVAVEEVFGLPEISDDAMDSMRGNSIEDIITFLECQLADTPSFTRNSYAAGSEAGINDKLKNLAPAYISGDELGADSEAHRGYILGYIDGYNAVTGC